MARNKF